MLRVLVMQDRDDSRQELQDYLAQYESLDFSGTTARIEVFLMGNYASWPGQPVHLVKESLELVEPEQQTFIIKRGDVVLKYSRTYL